ncbi:hypothetical protein DACRYDRAFT_115219 [Dacryopinax primogenitus]|uniref:WW domain-containing protein n=1 Tax=Dacryopinax primogenitus (strain DJM 731) TaxID=1858805 RepID=M5G5G3_DACPD|nr:uncharacterized protein DACRYDRAFT_115219 [Dacryopinax primogenitus]EJU03929.1 hypothetical protein DACRYDRAFT_115219 [Dacryopinax primogenitus]
MNVPPPPLPIQPLPEGWTEHISPIGLAYYYHAPSRTSIWLRPTLETPLLIPTDAEGDEHPIARKIMSGTGWAKIKTNRGNVFWRNAQRGVSVWEIPEELERTRKRALEEEGEEGSNKRMKVQEEEEDGEEEEGEEDGRKEEQEAREAATRWAQEEQARQEAAAAAELEAAEEEKAAAAAAAAKPAIPNLTPDEARAVFLSMLRELNISPLLPYEDALPLLVKDSRYSLLPSASERLEVFNSFCRTAASSRPASVKLSAEEEFAKLLRKEVTSTRTSWTEWRRKWRKDRRFWGWAGDREREGRFRAWLKELGERKRLEAERASREFGEMLAEQGVEGPWSEVKRRFAGDRRYDDVGSSSLREELYNAYLSSRASTSTSAPTAGASASAPAPSTKSEKHESKLERQQRALREREAQVRQELQRASHQAGESRALLGAGESEREFASLLLDAVRELDVSWAQALPALRSDPRFRGLSEGRKQQMFAEHRDQLRLRQIGALRTLFLAHAPELDTPFSALPVSLITSLPASKLGLNPRTLAKEFDTWCEEKLATARKEFDDMLRENSFVQFWGQAKKLGQASAAEAEQQGVQLEETAAYGDEEEFVSEEADGAGGLGKRAAEVGLEQVERVLRGDRRWRAWDWKREERDRWLREWMEGMKAPALSVHTA